MRIHDERLEKSLGVRYFGMPAGGKNRDGIAYARFPEWYFCPKCRRFQPLSKWIAEFDKKAKEQEKTNNRNMSRRLYCPKDRVELVVARIVTVCERGHINDFPWVKWTHAKSFGLCEPAAYVHDKPSRIGRTGRSQSEMHHLQCIGHVEGCFQ